MDSSIKSLTLPKIIKPFVFAKKNLKFISNFNLLKVPNLKNVVSCGNLDINLAFDIKNRVAFATGDIKINAKLCCVNCLEDVDFEYKNDLKVAFVSGEFDESSLKDYEIIDCEFDGEILTFDFITDEVLLALPMFAKHDKDCIKIGTTEELKPQKKENPFAVLKDIYK
jgi:uncharacterized metal-binding protein YceD (DUF177 family)